MKVWGLQSCDTCRRAVKELRAAGWEPDRVDVRADGVETLDLERFYKAFGAALVNQRSTTWRGLSPDERAADPIRQITAHPTLMKRPVIEADGVLTLGWTTQTRDLWLGKAGRKA